LVLTLKKGWMGCGRDTFCRRFYCKEGKLLGLWKMRIEVDVGEDLIKVGSGSLPSKLWMVQPE
jgi:hypothetical protein